MSNEMMSYETIILTKKDYVSTVTLNRPDKLNAMNDRMFEELIDVFTMLDKDADTRVIVLAAQGRGFCSGGDLTMSIYNTTDMNILSGFMVMVGDLIKSIRKNSKTVIASVNGVAAGGGINLALACDMIVASEKAKFSAIFATMSLHPDSGATYFLPRLIGTAKAMELLMTGRMVLADEAKEMGMVNHVVPHENLTAKTTELAQSMTKVAPAVARMIKVSAYHGSVCSLDESLENEARSVMNVMLSGVWKESMKK